jgi:hypothetical protein
MFYHRRRHLNLDAIRLPNDLRDWMPAQLILAASKSI